MSSKQIVPPDQVLGRLKALTSIPEQQLSNLARIANSEIGYHVKSEELREDLVAKTAIAGEALGAILEVVSELVETRRVLENQFHIEIDLRSFVDSLWGGFENKFRTEMEIYDFRKQLTALMSCKALSFPSRVEDVRSSNLNNFKSARVISDLRPIFDFGKIESGPKAATVVHDLIIEYFQDEETKSFIVSLDHDDILKLSEVLSRGLDKEEYILKLIGDRKD